MRRISTGLLRATFTAFALLLGATALAQLPTTITISSRTQEVDDLLNRGRQMELERRWGDALTHYEEALRQFPADSVLQRRFDSARLHYDIQRRSIDRSFSETLTRLPLDRALDLYAQVLLKIDSHYVDSPDWKDLVERGTNNLEVALSEPVFLERYVPETYRPATRGFCADLRAVLSVRPIRTREEAGQAVAVAAALAQKRLAVPSTVAALEYLCGATNSLDQYSSFLTPDQLNEVYSQIEGNFVGLGIELKVQQSALTIIRVITGSPAEQAGVRPGDRIIAVDGQITSSMSTDQAANLLQGVEGSYAALTVAGDDGQQRQMNVRRRRIDVPSVDQVSMIDREKGIGYFKLNCFQKTTAHDLDAALWKLQRDGMRSLIVDVRGNPGGLLVASVEAVNRFVDHGIVVTTHGRSAQEDNTFTAHAEGIWQIPLVVIVDQDSASAAEIFAGAIQDLHRGTIVGVRTYGKGSVQGIFPLDGTTAGIRLTTAKFYSPSGRPYSGIGVEPDVSPARLAAKPVDGQSISPAGQADAMLTAALELARGGSQTLQARNPR
ncbi:MAG: S41 family peptidase [Thermoguttaceae bacterium]|jgi:carboxyl-terminal processing protease